MHSIIMKMVLTSLGCYEGDPRTEGSYTSRRDSCNDTDIGAVGLECSDVEGRCGGV